MQLLAKEIIFMLSQTYVANLHIALFSTSPATQLQYTADSFRWLNKKRNNSNTNTNTNANANANADADANANANTNTNT